MYCRVGNLLEPALLAKWSRGWMMGARLPLTVLLALIPLTAECVARVSVARYHPFSRPAHPLPPSSPHPSICTVLINQTG